eukprot:2089572-Rhodomonas_salina.3
MARGSTPSIPHRTSSLASLKVSFCCLRMHAHAMCFPALTSGMVLCRMLSACSPPHPPVEMARSADRISCSRYAVTQRPFELAVQCLGLTQVTRLKGSLT